MPTDPPDLSALPRRPPVRDPRTPCQEIADLLAAALLRLRARQVETVLIEHSLSEPVCLGLPPSQRLNANPSQREGENA